jgi:hypothetical protein
MSDSEEEREMIRIHKIEAKKASAELDRQGREATKAANERIRLMRIEHDKEHKVMEYAQKLFNVKYLRDVPGLAVQIMDRKMTTTKELDDFIKNNKKYSDLLKPKPNKDTIIEIPCLNLFNLSIL